MKKHHCWLEVRFIFYNSTVRNNSIIRNDDFCSFFKLCCVQLFLIYLEIFKFQPEFPYFSQCLISNEISGKETAPNGENCISNYLETRKMCSVSCNHFTIATSFWKCLKFELGFSNSAHHVSLHLKHNYLRPSNQSEYS